MTAVFNKRHDVIMRQEIHFQTGLMEAAAFCPFSRGVFIYPDYVIYSPPGLPDAASVTAFNAIWHPSHRSAGRLQDCV